MRRLPLFLALACALALVGPGSAAAKGRCAVKGSETVKKTSKVRVYWKAGADMADGEYLYGCVRESGVRRELYHELPIPNEIDHIGPLRIAGYHVAFAASYFCTVCGDPGPSATIDEVELRHDSHRRLERVRRYGARGGARVDALVLDHCGRIAYRAILDDAYSDDEDHDPRLFTWVPGGFRRLVDRGAIDRHSIRLDPGSVYWVRDGELREAPVEPPC
jgi:hypothetical protein